ncbi:UNVERIFIED_CONTAM: hypothetical protein PYX00_000725 [Menopon gallinae]|uniref:ZZ-type domain-containing protein n=1 Tax=Menopon gallinae TaxID=328185 RepID=A0AAW2IA86_9NEOP
MEGDNYADFKIYLIHSNQVKEIRRVLFSSSELKSFELMKNKVKDTFPALKQNEFLIYWKDLENENIVIRDGDEWSLARKLMLSDRKLYVSDLSEDKESTDSQDYLHEGVYCDGCHNEVKGYRYKCLQCSNYDLCENCERQHLHSEHWMLRVGQVNSHSKKIHDLPTHLSSFFCGDHQHCRRRHSEKSEHKGKRGRGRGHKKHCRNSECSGSDEEDDHGKEKRHPKFNIPRCANSFMDFIQNYEIFLNPSGTGGETEPKKTRVTVQTGPGVLDVAGNIIASVLNPVVGCGKKSGNGDGGDKVEKKDGSSEPVSPKEAEETVNEISQTLAEQKISGNSELETGKQDVPRAPEPVTDNQDVPGAWQTLSPLLLLIVLVPHTAVALLAHAADPYRFFLPRSPNRNALDFGSIPLHVCQSFLWPFQAIYHTVFDNLHL